LISVSLAGLALSTLFYRMYFVLFFISTYLLVRRSDAEAQHSKSATGSYKRNSMFKTVVFTLSLLLFVLVTSHWVTTLVRVFLAFQDQSGAEVFFGDLRKSTAVAQDILLAFCVFLGDSFIIYRLWVVWSDRRLVLVVPVLSLLGFAVGSLVANHVAWRDSDILTNQGLTYGLLCTLLTNVYCTVMISWRLWTVSRRTTIASGGRSLLSFLAICIESAGFHARSAWMDERTEGCFHRVEVDHPICFTIAGLSLGEFISMPLSFGAVVDCCPWRIHMLIGPFEL